MEKPETFTYMYTCVDCGQVFWRTKLRGGHSYRCTACRRSHRRATVRENVQRFRERSGSQQ